MTSLVSLILGFPIVLGLNYGILHPIKGLLDEAVPAVDVILVCPHSYFYIYNTCCPTNSDSLLPQLVYPFYFSLPFHF